MGLTKTDQFSTKHNEIALIAKALAHPARVAILEQLLRKDGCICGDLVDLLPLAQPTVSQHLKELKNAGIISGEIEGTAICYHVNPDRLSKLADILSKHCVKAKKIIQSKCC